MSGHGHFCTVSLATGRVNVQSFPTLTGPGRHEAIIGRGAGLAPGVYWAHLTQDGHDVSEHVAFVR